MTEIEGSVCTECERGKFYWRKYCGAYVCDTCGYHRGLARCFCGWNLYTQDDPYGDPEEILRRWG